MVVDESEEWSSQWIFQFKQLERRSLKGFKGIRTRDLRVAGALLYQLSYEATHWERGQFIEIISPVRSEMMWSIRNNSFLNCGCRWTRDLRVAGALHRIISYTSHHFTPHGRYEVNKLTSLPMCGFIAQLVFFQASSFQLLKLENSLRWSFFTLIEIVWELMSSALLSGSVNRRFHWENQTFLPEQHAKKKGFNVDHLHSHTRRIYVNAHGFMAQSINSKRAHLLPGHLSFYFGKAASRRIDKCPNPGPRFSDKSSTASIPC